MATCKECVHFGICKRGFPWADGKGGGWCEDFKDKSPFIEPPLRIGQDAWCIRDYKGVKKPQKSEVSEMYFNRQMKLIIVVKYVGRGEYGKTVFCTEEEANAALTERMKENG